MKWEPIETAPKDGTRIDLWSRSERVPNARWDARRKAWVHDWLGDFDSIDEVRVDGNPTHWMPLPPPPEAP